MDIKFSGFVFTSQHSGISFVIAIFSIILLPNYICDVVLIPLLQLKIKPLFYEINDNMQPNWDQLNTIISRKVKAVMIVHYFGFPQDLNKIKKYCLKNNLLLIEDNAHGHGGEYKGQLLGTFGDIGFSSPRKLYPIDYGGILYIKNDQKIILGSQIKRLSSHPKRDN